MVFICFVVGFHSGFHLVFIVFIVSQWFSLGLHLRIGHPTQNKEMCRALPLSIVNLLVGERLGIRCCGAKPVQVRNTAPMFVTAAQFLSYRTDNVQEMLAFNLAMQERFNIRVWQIPLPMESRRPDFPRCGCCFSRFVLENEQEYQFQSAVLEGEL